MSIKTEPGSSASLTECDVFRMNDNDVVDFVQQKVCYRRYLVSFSVLIWSMINVFLAKLLLFFTPHSNSLPLWLPTSFAHHSLPSLLFYLSLCSLISPSVHVPANLSIMSPVYSFLPTSNFPPPPPPPPPYPSLLLTSAVAVERSQELP